MSYTLYKTANFGPGRAGLSTAGYTLTGGARVTAGVAEVGTSTGIYGAVVTFPDGFAGSILWDTGQGGSTVYAAEEVNPVVLAPTGLDAVTVDSGHNLRQVAALDHAVLCGTVSGQDANAPVFESGGGSTTRVSAVTDASGNRTSVSLTPPA